jgi:hypothetical protein
VLTFQETRLVVAYYVFPGEAHGLRKAETIVAVLEAELAFLQRVLELGCACAPSPRFAAVFAHTICTRKRSAIRSAICISV